MLQLTPGNPHSDDLAPTIVLKQELHTDRQMASCGEYPLMRPAFRANVWRAVTTRACVERIAYVVVTDAAGERYLLRNHKDS